MAEIQHEQTETPLLAYMDPIELQEVFRDYREWRSHSNREEAHADAALLQWFIDLADAMQHNIPEVP
jgi:hypothetical protein